MPGRIGGQLCRVSHGLSEYIRGLCHSIFWNRPSGYRFQADPSLYLKILETLKRVQGLKKDQI